jgi:hypothetical protein
MLQDLGKSMGLPRGRNSTYTRRTWRLDAGDEVEGVVVGGLVMGCRVRRVVWWPSGEGGNE